MNEKKTSYSEADAKTLKWVKEADDAALFEVIVSELYTPVVGDVLDVHGCPHQFLSPRSRPMNPLCTIMVGRAMPIVYADVTGPQKEPFGLLTEALDQTRSGEVVVVGGGSKTYATWGEILTATVRYARLLLWRVRVARKQT